METVFPPPVDVDEIRRHVRETLPGMNNAPPEINRLANDVQPLLRAYDALRAENKRLNLTLEIAKEMRAWQKRYFKERTPSALTQSKQLERELDRRLDGASDSQTQLPAKQG